MEIEMTSTTTPEHNGLSGTDKAVLVFAAIGAFATAKAIAKRVRIRIRIKKSK